MSYAVVNWRKFQHYKDRRPPWIKLHRSLLDDRLFMSLPVASMALAPCFWLLASESDDGSFSDDLDVLEFRLHRSKKEIELALKGLMRNGFLMLHSGSDGNVLAPCLPVAVPETETETETETEGDSLVDTDVSTHEHVSSEKIEVDKNHIPYKQVIDSWNSICGDVLQKVTLLNDPRRAAIRQRIKDADGADALAVVFQRVRASHFLSGYGRGKDGGSPFRATFDWVMAPKNWAKVVDGNYDNRGAGRTSTRKNSTDLRGYDDKIEEA